MWHVPVAEAMVVAVFHCACSELFPTLIRSAVLGYQNQAARIGGIIAPFIVMAGTAAGSGKASAVPFLVFGVAGLLAGLLVFTLPETLGVPLPDTIQVRGCGSEKMMAAAALSMYCIGISSGFLWY